MKLPRPINRRVESFLVGPASIRNAIAVLVAATVVTTLVGASLVLVFDHDRFDDAGDALWWALQTVTTVGYGDVTPSNGIGRVIGALVLLYSVAFMSILTAAITTSFVEKARRERASEQDPPGIHTVLERLDELAARIDRLDGRDRSAGDPADGGGVG
jgi:voltage-gated potassium channel